MTISYPLIKNENLPPNGSHSFFLKKSPTGIYPVGVFLYFKSFYFIGVLINCSYAVNYQRVIFTCLAIDYHIAVEAVGIRAFSENKTVEFQYAL